MLCWSRYLFIAVVICLGTASMLTACGQKGPLYLPEESSEAPAADTVDANNQAESKE